ncbi:hypothetical protein LA080_008044 [Diaporthe eres]|nr:hypothetical protein LA080_008044 [Diaporthe eres]
MLSIGSTQASVSPYSPYFCCPIIRQVRSKARPDPPRRLRLLCGLVYDRVSKALRWSMTGLAVVYSGIPIPKVMVCTPISAYWGITANVGVNGRNPYCLNQSYVFIADISVAVLTDFIILIVPIPLALLYRMVKVIQFLGSTDPIADFTVLSIFT